MPVLEWLNARGSLIRWPLKILCGGLIALVVLFPRLDRLPTTLKRHRDPNQLIEPGAQALAPLLAEFEQQRRPEWDPATLLRELERFVYDKIPYAWDWELWGNVDYFPTVTETVTKGREDCDGRAVVAASVLRHYGYQARLATDFGHVWVVTDRGETMSPGKRKAVEFTEAGPRVDWRALRDVPRMFGLGVSVFPLHRELILVFGLWILLIGRHVRPAEAAVWLAVLVVGLMLVREAGRAAPVKLWAGIGLWAVACVGLVIQGRRAHRTSGETA